VEEFVDENQPYDDDDDGDFEYEVVEEYQGGGGY